MATLKEQIEADIAGVFFKDDTEFSDLHKIGTNSKSNAYTVLASLQSNTIDNGNFDGKAPLQMVSHTCIVAYPIGGKLRVNADQILYIDDEAYKVIDVLDEMGVATILLKKGADKRGFGNF